MLLNIFRTIFFLGVTCNFTSPCGSELWGCLKYVFCCRQDNINDVSPQVSPANVSPVGSLPQGHCFYNSLVAELRDSLGRLCAAYGWKNLDIKSSGELKIFLWTVLDRMPSYLLKDNNFLFLTKDMQEALIHGLLHMFFTVYCQESIPKFVMVMIKNSKIKKEGPRKGLFTSEEPLVNLCLSMKLLDKLLVARSLQEGCCEKEVSEEGKDILSVVVLLCLRMQRVWM